MYHFSSAIRRCTYYKSVFTGFGLIGEFYTDIVGSDGWNIFIVILSLICGYFVYHQASEDNNE